MDKFVCPICGAKRYNARAEFILPSSSISVISCNECDYEASTTVHDLVCERVKILNKKIDALCLLIKETDRAKRVINIKKG